MINEEILIKRNQQISLKSKILFCFVAILSPFSLLFLLTNYDLWIRIAPIILLLFLERSLLDLPPEYTKLNYTLLFRPIKSIKGIIQLLKPTEDETLRYPFLKFIFNISMVFFVIYRLFFLLIIIGLLYIIIKL